MAVNNGGDQWQRTVAVRLAVNDGRSGGLINGGEQRKIGGGELQRANT
jgi:hypothetical protein